MAVQTFEGCRFVVGAVRVTLSEGFDSFSRAPPFGRAVELSIFFNTKKNVFFFSNKDIDLFKTIFR